jgi:hypothetical protein
MGQGTQAEEDPLLEKNDQKVRNEDKTSGKEEEERAHRDVESDLDEREHDKAEDAPGEEQQESVGYGNAPTKEE